jgi:sugar lactone lactonase YvrE
VGNKEVVVQVDFPAFPTSIDFAADDRHLIVPGRDGWLPRREPGGSLARDADLHHLSRHPWNDDVVDRAGNAYVGKQAPRQTARGRRGSRLGRVRPRLLRVRTRRTAACC